MIRKGCKTEGFSRTLSSILLSLDPMELLPLSLALSSKGDNIHVKTVRREEEDRGFLIHSYRCVFFAGEQWSDSLPVPVWNRVIFPKDWSSLRETMGRLKSKECTLSLSLYCPLLCRHLFSSQKNNPHIIYRCI